MKKDYEKPELLEYEDLNRLTAGTDEIRISAENPDGR
jgi:hypothetical protein